MKTIPALFAIAAAGLTAVGLPGGAIAAESDGESSSVLACFYECKPGLQTTWWSEVTTLMLVNANSNLAAGITANLAILNGNEAIIAHGSTLLSPDDLDEVNICRTLQANGIAPPSAGVVEIALTDGASPTAAAVGAYAWVKNVVGKFFKTVDEPFAGVVNGVGKTGCRVVPPSIATASQVLDKIDQSPLAAINPILIEGTADAIP